MGDAKVVPGGMVGASPLHWRHDANGVPVAVSLNPTRADRIRATLATIDHRLGDPALAAEKRIALTENRARLEAWLAEVMR